MTTKRNVCVGTLACVGTFVCAGTLERRPDQVSGTLQDDRLKHARCEAPLRPRKNPASATIETILADIGTPNGLKSGRKSKRANSVSAAMSCPGGEASDQIGFHTKSKGHRFLLPFFPLPPPLPPLPLLLPFL